MGKTTAGNPRILKKTATIVAVIFVSFCTDWFANIFISIHQRVGKTAHVARRDPHLRVHQDGGLEARVQLGGNLPPDTPYAGTAGGERIAIRGNAQQVVEDDEVALRRCCRDGRRQRGAEKECMYFHAGKYITFAPFAQLAVSS